MLGGVPGGKPLISLSARPARTTIYVSLPPSGKRPNTRRYPIAIVGPGYHGILVSRSTRIRGLVSIADIAPTAKALERGERPVIQARADANPRAHLAELDRRLSRSHDVRLWETLILVAAVLGGAILAVLFRSEYLGRAGLLAAPSVLTAALILSAAEITRPHVVVTSLPAIALGLAALLAIPRALLPWALVGFLAGYLVVFVGWPEVASFSAIGASPDGGGRFYGAGNLVETVLLTVSLEAAALLGRRAILPVLVLTLVTVGWSKAGADGGGIVVLLAAFAVLASRMYGVRWTWRRAGRRRGRRRPARRRAGRARCGERRIEPRHPRVPPGPRLAGRGSREPRAHLGREPRREHDAGDRLRGLDRGADRAGDPLAAVPRRRRVAHGNRRLPRRQRQPGRRCLRRRAFLCGSCSPTSRCVDRRPTRAGSVTSARMSRASPLAREASISAGVAAMLAALLAWAGPPGTDLAAHVYQRALFLDHGFTLWNNFWYAGRYSFVTYSLLYYPLAAALGIRLLAVATVATATLAFAVVVWKEWGPRARWSSRTFAVVWAGIVLSAAFPFALGAALALLGLWALQARRPWRFAALAGLTAAASPIAFLLLVLIVVGLALGRRSDRWLSWRRARAYSRSSSSRPWCCGCSRRAAGIRSRVAELAAACTYCALSTAFAWRAEGARTLRWIFPVYGVACLTFFFVSSGVGENVARLRYAAIPVSVLVLSLRNWRPSFRRWSSSGSRSRGT